MFLHGHIQTPWTIFDVYGEEDKFKIEIMDACGSKYASVSDETL